MTDRPRFFDRFDTPPPATSPTATVVPIRPGEADQYATTALNAECQAVATEPEGSRNHRLNVAAFNLGQLVAAGALTHDTVTEALTTAAAAAGLHAAETARTIHSGLTGGIKSGPRHIAPRADPGPALTFTPAATSTPARTATRPDTSGADDEEPAGPDTERPRTSWWPQPVQALADAAAAAPEPCLLHRTDGQALMYAGKVNGLLGESESGKSWLGLHAVTQELAAGHRCLILDFEDNPATVRDRLTLLGATPHQLARLDYAHPDTALDLLAAEDLTEALHTPYTLIVVDGINAAMTLLGYDLNSNTDATLFNRRVLKPLTSNGAGVLTIDHLPKDTEKRGKGGIGAQAKRAMLDGCAITVDVTRPFGRGQNGRLRLTIDKDRTGHVRGVSAGGKHAGTAHIDSADDYVRIAITIDDSDPAGHGDAWKPTGLMEKLSRTLEEHGPLGSNEALERVGGKKQWLLQAKDALVQDGYVRVEVGPNRKQFLHSERSFREADLTLNGQPITPTSPVVPADREPLDGQESCNKCGDTLPTAEVDRGYCLPCRQDMGRS